jgi:catechol 2,3-dioxygenase-like lactoylglutathione lyase family enzyme
MLTDARLVHLVLYANDLAISRAFYADQLGLPITHEDDDSVTIDAGPISLRLERASRHGVTLAGRRDDSSDVVFLVDDIAEVRAMLEARGVEFMRRRNYEVGTVMDFYDPNGHRLMLYEPSEEALTWPSADRVRAVWAGWGRGRSTLIGPPATRSSSTSLTNTGLAGKPLIYLFMFESDAARAFAFYHGTLRLTPVERVHCCNQTCPGDVEGIVKYDVGNLLLSTHHLHENGVVLDDYGRPYSPREFNPEHAKGIAAVFEVPDVSRIARALARADVSFEREPCPGRPELPVRFTDPFGHPIYAVQALAAEAAAAGSLVAAG